MNLLQMSEYLILPYSSQDWGIINSDKYRILEFIEFYKNYQERLDAESKNELIDLIFESFNDHLEEKKENKEINNIVAQFYLSCRNETEIANKLNYWFTLKSTLDFPIVNHFKLWQKNRIE